MHTVTPAVNVCIPIKAVAYVSEARAKVGIKPNWDVLKAASRHACRDMCEPVESEFSSNHFIGEERAMYENSRVFVGECQGEGL